MTPKPFPLRTAVITVTAAATGSGAGGLAEAIAQHLGCAQPGIAQLAAAITTLWILDKLNALIGS